MGIIRISRRSIRNNREDLKVLSELKWPVGEIDNFDRISMIAQLAKRAKVGLRTKKVETKRKY